MKFTSEQQRAIDLRQGSLLVSAGAGTGKTSVLVERFVRAVLDDGVSVDAILAITFTEKAAAQLTSRVRARLMSLGARSEARRAEAAWISTIHGFCSRVLRTHALAAGIDPEFRVLDALESERLGIDAFDRALAQFVGSGDDPERLRLLGSYTPDRLADMVRTAYAHGRSRGEARPELPEALPPRPAGEREALGAAVQAALGEIAAAEGSAVTAGRSRLERCAALLDHLEEDAVADAAELKDFAVKGTAKALKGAACEEFRIAHEAYLALCVRHREYSDHVLLRDLIRRHGHFYDTLKRDRSGLDFDDLELLARDLLEGDEGLRSAYAERFAHVMVDEFQDTNPLQNEILDSLDRDNLFRVGDERQSIYRFRHADVKVFRRHRDEAASRGREQPITVNFRSRGEILDAVDLVFGEVWGDAFEPLREAPGAHSGEPRIAPCVELLVSDREKKRWDARFAAEHDADEAPFGASMRDVTPWRAAEARLLARRIDELTAAGPYRFGDVVLLLRATTHIGVYERALEERGIPTYVLGGRGYWSQQQVADLRAYLAALANPLDELALYSVLASPLGGVSLDALVMVAAAARSASWDVGRVVEAVFAIPAGGAPEAVLALVAELPAADARALREFARRFAAERGAAPRVSLETLIDRAVTGSGYDRAILAMPAGERRMANVRKLMRMAREFEADEGRDLRGFIDFVAERDLIAEREGQAPLEAEALDAVRLMTVHRAKGLEFPVVCVGDLGKAGREDDSALRITDDGRVGIRLASIGGGAIDSSQLAGIREQEKLEDEEEEKRIFYVAATRAQEHLVLSGATDLEKLPPEAPLEEPMRWIWRGLAPDLAGLRPRDEACGVYDGRGVRVRCEVLRPEGVDELLPAADREPATPEPEPPGLDALQAPALTAVPVPEGMAVSRLSYSSLERYRRCGYRFYLEHALGLRGAEAPDAGPGASGEQPLDGLPGLVRGSLVHLLLERLDFNRPASPEVSEVAELIQSAGHPVRDADVAELIGMVDAFAGSALSGRIAAADRVRTELPFAFTLDTGGRSVLVNGVVDVHAAEADGAVLIVDYKSDRLGESDPATLTEASYSTQRLVYALAALRSGARSAEVAYAFLERPGEPVLASFEASDAPDLERGLLELAEGVVAGRFEPTDRPQRRLCGDCPGQPALCSWPPERTLAEAPA
ncbi:MAG: UvrD-helicase domain-containing protein [Actinomycetota bacterium]|nr:UvrD-helicase domain-containing protein [Actinomycetota bacterium]